MRAAPYFTRNHSLLRNSCRYPEIGYMLLHNRDTLLFNSLMLLQNSYRYSIIGLSTLIP